MTDGAAPHSSMRERVAAVLSHALGGSSGGGRDGEALSPRAGPAKAPGDTPPTGRKRGGDASALITSSSRKRARAMSAATASKHRPALQPAAEEDGAEEDGLEEEQEEEEDVAPRALERTFETGAGAAGADGRHGAVGHGGEAAAAERASALQPVVKAAGGMLSTLFSPSYLYNLFAGAPRADDAHAKLAGGEAPGAAKGDGEGKAAAEAEELAGAREAEEDGDDEGDGEPEAPDDEDGDEEEDFDPYLFISTLPPLSTCVPPADQRVAVLPRRRRGGPKNTLVLDLDETLVHSTLEDQQGCDFSFPVQFNNQTHTVNVRRRPELERFMEHVAKKFEVVIFTASQRVYAERLLDILDPGQRVIKHRIFRDSCVFVDGNYLKDLTVLGRDLARTIIVDNSPQAFGFQIDNGIPIESWFDDPQDRELMALLPFLDKLSQADDVRPLIKAQFRLKDKVERAAAARAAAGGQ